VPDKVNAAHPRQAEATGAAFPGEGIVDFEAVCYANIKAKRIGQDAGQVKHKIGEARHRASRQVILKIKLLCLPAIAKGQTQTSLVLPADNEGRTVYHQGLE
jgi:hypothetical protein